MLAKIHDIELHKSFNTKNAESQIKLLHSDADKFITVATIDRNGRYNQWHYKIDELEQNLERLVSLNLNTYISPNEFYIPKRSAEHIRRLNALYVDLDLVDKTYNITDDELNLAIDILRDEYFNNIIPEPTMVIKTGRGIHLYWKIEDLPSQGLPLWTLIQNKMLEKIKIFREQFRILKIDNAVKDCTRVLRLTDTINLKNNTMCKLEYLYEENIYRLDNLVEEYFKELKIIDKQKKEKVKIKSKEDRTVIAMYNLYSLHYARLKDIVKLQQIRNSISLDARRRMVFMYRYYSCLYNHDIELALENTLDFNNKFIEPLSEKEVIQASNSAEKAYEEWLTNKAEDFNKPVWDRETSTYNLKGYNYSNTKLISLLEITLEEQRELSTIISKRVKLDRFNDKRKEDRRNEHGLTKREQQKQDTINKVQELKLQGFTQKEVAEKLNKGIATIKRYWNM